MSGYHLIAEEASRLAKLLPPSVVEAVAARLECGDGPDASSLRGRIADRSQPASSVARRDLPRPLEVAGQ